MRQSDPVRGLSYILWGLLAAGWVYAVGASSALVRYPPPPWAWPIVAVGIGAFVSFLSVATSREIAQEMGLPL